MKIEVINPSQKLSGIVKCYWTLEKDSGSHTERLYPCGETQILFHYGKPFTEITGNNSFKQPHSIACGQLTTFKDVLAVGSAGLIGIIFQPYTISTILHVASHELSQGSFDLTDINKIFREVENKIREASSTTERIKIIENFLIKRVSVTNQFHFWIIRDSVNLLSASENFVTVKELAQKQFMSERQLERIFKDYIGLSPKSFTDIMRFKKAFYLLQDNKDLTNVSLTSGYYDQSHFIRSFKRYAGKTPGEYLKLLI